MGRHVHPQPKTLKLQVAPYPPRHIVPDLGSPRTGRMAFALAWMGRAPACTRSGIPQKHGGAVILVRA